MTGFNLNIFKEIINNTLRDKEPWQIVSFTTMTVLSTVWIWNFVFQEESILKRGKKQIFKFARYVPSIRNKIDQELTSINTKFQNDAIERIGDVAFIEELPLNGMTKDQILSLAERCAGLGNYDWKGGKVSGAVYRNDKNLVELIENIYAIASYTNPLHPDIFPGICKMEAEVVRIACSLFNGDKKSCGTMTTGGTESILLACKAYRDYAKEMKGVKHPEIVMPVTAHSAFDKAAQFLNLRIRSVPVDPISYTVSIKDMRNCITKNTIMLVGSAPNFPYGTMDSIESIAKLGIEFDVPVHVDACLGGFLICFMENAGFELPPFDFRLPGVTSISADTHKYGYAPKGSSVILYKESKYRHHQYTITTDWPGGIYGSPTVNGSRAGGVIATCWATLMYLGHDGYVEATQQVVQTAKYIEQELRKLEGIFIFGNPVTSVIALGSDKFHIYRLSEALNNRGWNLNPLQFPCGIHICVTHLHTQPGVAEQFLSDVKEELSIILKDVDVPVEGQLAMYGMTQSIPDRSVVEDLTRFFLDSLYYTPNK